MIHRYTQTVVAMCAIGLLLIQLQGPWLYFKIQQSQLRSEIKQRLKAGVQEKDLVTLKIAKAWEEKSNPRFTRIHSKEFRFDAELYDIVRSTEQGDTTVYVCIHDVQESGLFARLDQMVEEENQCPMQREKRKKAEDTLSQQFFPAQTTFVAQATDSTLDQFYRMARLQIQPQETSSPPPEREA